MKDQALSFSETPFEYSQDQILSRVQGFQKLGLNTTVVHLQTCLVKLFIIILVCSLWYQFQYEQIEKHRPKSKFSKSFNKLKQTRKTIGCKSPGLNWWDIT